MAMRRPVVSRFRALLLAAPLLLPATASATLDLELTETGDLASQLSSREWLMSMPGSIAQKDQLAYQVVSCAYCHTYERIVKSRHAAERFVPVITRMQTYFGDGTAVSRSGRGRGQRNEHPELAAENPDWGNAPKTELAAYLATVNLSGGRTTWPYELQTLPRPTGRATRVIITQYDLPRPDTVPHDMTIDSTGTPWFPDQSRMFIGRLDPRTGAATEYPLPPLPPGEAMHEFPMARRWTTPYTASAPDGDGYVYAPSNMSERLMRLDPATEPLE